MPSLKETMRKLRGGRPPHETDLEAGGGSKKKPRRSPRGHKGSDAAATTSTAATSSQIAPFQGVVVDSASSPPPPKKKKSSKKSNTAPTPQDAAPAASVTPVAAPTIPSGSNTDAVAYSAIPPPPLAAAASKSAATPTSLPKPPQPKTQAAPAMTYAHRPVKAPPTPFTPEQAQQRRVGFEKHTATQLHLEVKNAIERIDRYWGRLQDKWDLPCQEEYRAMTDVSYKMLYETRLGGIKDETAAEAVNALTAWNPADLRMV